MEESLRLKDDPGTSYSFQFGDAFRKSIGKPWLLPILPFMLVKRFAEHRSFMKKSVTNLCIFAGLFNIIRMNPISNIKRPIKKEMMLNMRSCIKKNCRKRLENRISGCNYFNQVS